MHAIMLAAGMGSRLSQNDQDFRPKCLLEFDGQSLLARHVEILRSNGVANLTLVVGYHKEDIFAELAAIGATDFVETITNPKFKNGSILSLACASKVMKSGVDILFMDADVLYHPDILLKLISSDDGSRVLFDPSFEPGEEPVVLGLNNNRIAEFTKNPEIDLDSSGEWPGFVKWSPQAAGKIADIIDRRISEGLINAPYEDAFREYMLSEEGISVTCEDIAGLPWIEIDFQEDVERARNIILPAIKT